MYFLADSHTFFTFSKNPDNAGNFSVRKLIAFPTAVERPSYIELPKNLDTVCGSVFFMCESLTELVFPDTLLHLYDDFMCHCSSLKKVVIPKSLKDVLYSDAFLGCDNLQYVEMPATAYNKRAHKLPANVNLVLV